MSRALIEGLEHDVLAKDASIRALIPLQLKTCRAAAQAALAAEQTGNAAGRWTEGSMLHRQRRADFAFHAKRMHADAVAAASAAAVWRELVSIGGANRYYFLDALWKVRGRFDEMWGGTGLTRGRRDRHDLAMGDAADFWRVVALEPGCRLTLLSEMKLPGWRARPRLLARDDAAHGLIFNGLARSIAARAESAARSQGRPKSAFE